MPELSAKQADELAGETLALKKAVGEFRQCFFNTLTPEQRDGLQTLTIELGNEVDHLTAVAIRLTLAEVQTTLTHLREITSGVNDAVARAGEVRKVITIATSLASLAAAIASPNPGTILSALQDAATSIK